MDTEMLWQESRRQWNVPNALTYSRALVGITLPLWWLGGPLWLLAAVSYALVSDFLDGWLARLLKAETPIGSVIDPLADKVFTDLFLLMLAFTSGALSFAVLAVITILYDIDNIYQRRTDIVQAFRGDRSEPSKPVTWLSKTKTAMLFALMVAAIVPAYLPVITVDQLALFCVYLVLASWWHNRCKSVLAYFGL